MEKRENIVRKLASKFKSKMSSFLWKHNDEGPRKTTKEPQTVHE